MKDLMVNKIMNNGEKKFNVCIGKDDNSCSSQKKLDFNLPFDDSSSSEEDDCCSDDTLKTYSYMFSDELPIFAIDDEDELSSIDDEDEDDNNSLIEFSVSQIDLSSSNDCEIMNSSYPSNERTSLEDIHNKIGHSRYAHSEDDCENSTKRLYLETIHEGVFLETPPKKYNKYLHFKSKCYESGQLKGRKLVLNNGIDEETEKGNVFKDFNKLHLSTNT